MEAMKIEMERSYKDYFWEVWSRKVLKDVQGEKKGPS